MKKIFAIFLLIILAGCTAPQVNLEEVTDESLVDEDSDTTNKEETSETAPFYNLTEGQTIEVLGHEISLTKIYPNPEVDIIIDNQETKLKETKNEEIIDDLKIMIYLIHDVYLQEKYVTLKIEKLELGENEYILQKGERITIGNQDVVLESSQTDGYIQVSVFNKGTIIGETEEIKRGASLEIEGLTITNLKNYYKVEQYAWVTIE